MINVVWSIQYDYQTYLDRSATATQAYLPTAPIVSLIETSTTLSTVIVCKHNNNLATPFPLSKLFSTLGWTMTEALMQEDMNKLKVKGTNAQKLKWSGFSYYCQESTICIQSNTPTIPSFVTILTIQFAFGRGSDGP